MLLPDILADIVLYKTENGGRKGPTPSTFFGCTLKINEKNYDARLLLDSIGSIFPGEKRSNVPIKFLCWETAFIDFSQGTKFFIRDGQIVGEGIVVFINK